MAHDHQKATRRTGTGQRNVFQFPSLESTDEDILAFKDRHFNDDSVYRNRRLEQATQNLFYVANRQWTELDTDVILDGVRGYILRDLISTGTPDVELPRPTTNKIGVAVEIELSSQGKSQLIPNILTSSRDPRVKLGANHAKEILEYRNRIENWPEIRELSTFINIVTGTVGIHSYWDEKSSELTALGSPHAVECPSCGRKYASSRIPRETLQMQEINNTWSLRDLTEGDPDNPEVIMTHCPSCSGADPLRPYMVESVQDGMHTDPFGRQMGMLFRKGNTSMDVVTPWQMFPQNGGIDVYPHTFKMMGVRTVRDIDWVLERYPDLEDVITPADPFELMAKHPVLGEWQIAGHYESDRDSGIYENSVAVYEMTQEKGFRFPKGARFVVVGDDLVAERGPLYHELEYEGENGQPETIEATKSMVAVSRFKMNIGQFYGTGLPENLISPQNRMNGIDSQVISVRERWGSPHVMLPSDMDLTGPEWISQYGSGMILRYRPSSQMPQAEPKAWGGNVNPSGFYQERDRIDQDMKELAGPPSIEIGEAPKNITTTSGLQLLGEAAERRRGPRERSQVEMYQKVWRHRLEMLNAFRVENDTYEAKTGDKTYEIRSFNRRTLAGQTNAVVEKQGYIDKSIWIRESSREAQADGLYDINSQAVKKRLLEMRGLPTDVNIGEFRQVDVADEMWIDYIEDGIVGVTDETLDDPKIRYEVLGEHLVGDKGREIAKEVGWDKVCRVIAGWEKDLTRAELMNEETIRFYQGMSDPKNPQVQELYASAMVKFAQDKLAFDNQPAPPPGVPPPLPLPPPMPPPQPVFLPPLKQDKIFNIWKKKLESAGLVLSEEAPPFIDPLTGAEAPSDPMAEQTVKLTTHLRFRSLYDSYRLMSKDRAMEAMMGIPVPPAPGQGSGGATGPAGALPPNPMNPTNPTNPPNPPNPGGGAGRGAGV